MNKNCTYKEFGKYLRAVADMYANTVIHRWKLKRNTPCCMMRCVGCTTTSTTVQDASKN